MSSNIYYPETYENLPSINQDEIEEIIIGACNRIKYNIRELFPTTYLYIKQHTVTGKLYFGKTMQDVNTYPGSGVYWTKHINKYGKDKVQTIWSKEFNNPYEIVKYALQFSIINNIVDSQEWTNLMSENGLDGGFASCKHYKNISTGEVRMFHTSVPIPDGYEKFAYTKNSKWYTNTKTGEVIRSCTKLTGDWINQNAHLKGASQYIDPNGVLHQVKPENAKPDWVLYSHSQGKRLYSDGKTVTLFEHNKQPPGWEIYDEKFGKKMYTLPDGKRKWFKPGTEPQGAVEFVSSKGCRQYINLETNNIIQVPHGTQPEGYVEYSATSGAIWVIDKLGTQKRIIDLDNIPDEFVLRPTRWKFGISHINNEGVITKLTEPKDGWFPYQETTKQRCNGWNFEEYYQNMIKNVKAQ